MKKVTSITTHATAEGTRISITYSEISEAGVIEKDNIRETRVVVDKDALEIIGKLQEFAQTIADSSK